MQTVSRQAFSASGQSGEIELAEVAQACASAGRPDLLGQIICLDAESQTERADMQCGIQGLHSVGYRVGAVAGTTLLGRLGSSAFAYRDIALDCRLVLLDRPRWSNRKSLRIV
jgi:hypothetical protein